jgi:DNA polymerase III epsilon subunit-like protein
MKPIICRLLNEVAKRCPGKKLPDNYFVFDTETTGVNKYSDRIVQYGYCLVINKKKECSEAQLIDRSMIKMHPKAIEAHGITSEYMKANGIPVGEYVPTLVELMLSVRSSGGMFVGHNMMAFDVPMFEQETMLLKIPFKFKDNEVIDTGMIVKAAQLDMNFRPEESLRNFYLRISEIRSRVKWSLAGYCFDTFELEKSGVSRDKAHDAGSDCVLTHYLFEKLRTVV